MKRLLRRLAVFALAFGLVLADVQATYKPAGLVLLQSITASNSASVDFTANITGKYKTYVIEFWDVSPAATGSHLYLRFYDGAWQADAGDYFWSYEGRQTDSTSWFRANDSNAAQIRLSGHTLSTSTGDEAYGTIKIWAPADTGILTRARYSTGYGSGAGGVLYELDGGGHFSLTNAVTGFRLLMSATNINTGTFRLYGRE